MVFRQFLEKFLALVGMLDRLSAFGSRHVESSRRAGAGAAGSVALHKALTEDMIYRIGDIMCDTVGGSAIAVLRPKQRPGNVALTLSPSQLACACHLARRRSQPAAGGRTGQLP